jgi:hypothetical protein
LDHQRVDVDQRRLERVHLLIFLPIYGQLACVAIEDESIGAVPTLHDVESIVDLPSGLLLDR